MTKPVSMFSRTYEGLTEQEIDQIAEKAAQKAIEKLTAHVYQEVGRSVISKLFWITGALLVGLYLWFKLEGIVK